MSLKIGLQEPSPEPNPASLGPPHATHGLSIPVRHTSRAIFAEYGYNCPMDAAKMDALLAEIKPNEVEDALRFVEICERDGGTPAEEADEWRRRFLGWQAFLGLAGGQPT